MVTEIAQKSGTALSPVWFHMKNDILKMKKYKEEIKSIETMNNGRGMSNEYIFF